MGMQLRFTLLPALPPLAWCATVRHGAADVDVVHGELVEVVGDRWFEGAWDGAFATFDPASAFATMGSGGVVDRDAVRFVAPSHTYEWLCTLAVGDGLRVANSLPCLLARTGDKPDVRYAGYHRDLLRLQRRGITGDTPATLPTARGRRVHLHAATDLRVGIDLVVRTCARPQPPEPGSFADYRALLAGAVERLVANATDGHRRTPLRAATTTSAGYDSTAATVLAAEAGVAEAVTLERSGDDSGATIAGSLGLRVHRIDADGWPSLGEAVVQEVLGGASGWAMLPLAGVADAFPATAVLLGTMGDDLWDRRHPRVGPSLSRPDEWEPAAAGLHELRLRAGITFIHVPTIGAIHADAIARLGRSDEMSGWSVGGDYDRPIPRRIVEDAGVPRDAFGRTVWMTVDVQPHELAEHLRRTSFARFLAGALTELPPFARWRLRTSWRWGDRVGQAVSRVVATLWGRARRLHPRGIDRLGWAATYALMRWRWHRPLPVRYTFHWANGALIDRYADALGPPTDREPTCS